MTREERITKIDEVLNRFANGELKPLAVKIMTHLVKGEGAAMVEDIMGYDYDALDYDDAVATISILRSSVFDFNMTHGWNTACPPTSEIIAQFWDEAMDIADGVSTLYIDTVETRYRKNDINGNVRYIHRILNCSVDHIYERELPYICWWLPTDDEAQTK